MGSNLEDDGRHEAENEESVDRGEFTAPRLVEGVRDLLLRWAKEARMQKPWDQMKEGEQQNLINQCEDRAEQLVADVVEVVNHGDFPVVNALIDSFTVKKGEVKVVTKGFADNEMLAILNSAGDKRVQITVMRNDQFDEERTRVRPTPDQPELPGTDEPGFEDDDDLGNPEGEDEEGAAILDRVSNPPVEDPPVETPVVEEPPVEEKPKRTRKPKADAPAEPKVDSASGEPSFTENDGDQMGHREEDPTPAEGANLDPVVDDNGDAEVEQPAVSVEVTDQNDEEIDSAESAHEYGAWCRSDGRGTGSNPFPVSSDFGKAWLRGYNEQKKKEAAGDLGGF